MTSTHNHVKTDPVDWKKELADLSAIPKTADEKAAVEAFTKAIGPYLDNPEMLRTILSKIQRGRSSITKDKFSMVVAQEEYGSLDELKSKLPRDVDIVEL